MVHVSDREVRLMVRTVLFGLDLPEMWTERATTRELELLALAVEVARTSRRQQFERIEAGAWPAITTTGEP